ncbi:unnamed protein product, partial [Prorocentrum cordatum]
VTRKDKNKVTFDVTDSASGTSTTEDIEATTTGSEEGRTVIGSTEHGGAPLLFPSMVQQDDCDIQDYGDECSPDACNIGRVPAEAPSGSCGGVSTSHHACDAVQVVQVVSAEAETVNAVVPNTFTNMILGSQLFEEVTTVLLSSLTFRFDTLDDVLVQIAD